MGVCRFVEQAENRIAYGIKSKPNSRKIPENQKLKENKKMDNVKIPRIEKVMMYKDDAKIIEANNSLIERTTDKLIEATIDARLAKQKITSKLIESFSKNAEITTASFCDNIANVNEVFERRLEQNQKDVRFRKFFTITNKSKWSKKAWNHAFEDYTQQVGMIVRAYRHYNQSLAFEYVKLVSCLNLLTSGEQPKEHENDPVPLLTGIIIDAARERGMVK